MEQKEDLVVPLTIEQFKAVGNAKPEEVVDSGSDAESDARSNSSAVPPRPEDSRWCTDNLKKEVRIDHIPGDVLERMRGAGVPSNALMYQIGTVTRCIPPVDGQPKFEIQPNNDQYGLFDKMADWPHLVYGRDFHFVEDLEGEHVVVTRPHYGMPGTPGYIPAIKAVGRVEEYIPDRGGLYKVKIPEHEVEVPPNYVQRERNVKNIYGDEVFEEAPDDLVGASVSFKDDATQHQLEGKIFAVHGEDDDRTYSIEVNGGSYYKPLKRDDFLVLQSASAHETMNPSGFDLVGEPVTFEDDHGETTLAIVNKVLSGPPYRYVVSTQDMEQVEKKESELLLVKNNALLGMEVQFRKPDGELGRGILAKIVAHDDPDLTFYWPLDVNMKAYRLLFKDLKFVNFKADERYQPNMREAPVGPALTGKAVEFIDDDGNVKKGTVDSCAPNAEGKDAAEYTYTLSGQDGRPHFMKQSQLIRVVPDLLMEDARDGLGSARSALESRSPVSPITSPVSEHEVYSSEDYSSEDLGPVLRRDERMPFESADDALPSVSTSVSKDSLPPIIPKSSSSLSPSKKPSSASTVASTVSGFNLGETLSELSDAEGDRALEHNSDLDSTSDSEREAAGVVGVETTHPVESMEEVTTPVESESDFDSLNHGGSPYTDEWSDSASTRSDSSPPV
jgi:hypothetical protein